MPEFHAWPWLVAIFAGVIAAVTDLRERKVYNWLTLPLCAGGVVYHAVFSGWYGLAASVGGLIFGFFIVLVPCFLGGVGPGDVKLLAGIGAWIRVPGIVWVFAVAGLAIGVWSAGIMLIGKTSLRAWRERIERMIFRLRWFHDYVASGQTLREVEGERGPLIPFAAFIAAAVAIYGGLLYLKQLPEWMSAAV